MPAMHAKGASGPWADPGEASVAILWIEEMALSKGPGPQEPAMTGPVQGGVRTRQNRYSVLLILKAALKENC